MSSSSGGGGGSIPPSDDGDGHAATESHHPAAAFRLKGRVWCMRPALPVGLSGPCTPPASEGQHRRGREGGREGGREIRYVLTHSPWLLSTVGGSERRPAVGANGE